PDAEVAIVHDRVLDPVAHDSGAQVRGLALGREFRGVHPDHDDLVGILALDFPQLRKEMHAVDSAEGPEVEEAEIPLEISQMQGSRDVQPIDTGRELRGTNLPKLRLVYRLLFPR